MISKIVVPDLGATGGDVSLLRWLVEPGEQVAAGKPLFLLETDKATVEVESFRDGLVHSLLVEAGSVVPIGALVALIADAMEETEPDAMVSDKPSRTRTPPTAAKPDAAVESRERILASPLARRMADMENLDLMSVKGTGTQGQILKRDIERFMAAAPSATEMMGSVQQEPLSPLRRTIASRTLQSKSQIPHFYAEIVVDMAAALEMKQTLAGAADKMETASPSITDLYLRAAALALAEFPILNASYQEEAAHYYQAINIGLVVSLKEGGMLVPVVHDAAALDLLALAALTRRLQEGAERGILGAADLSGGTFTLSNLGMYGLDSFTAIINPPQAGILALGAVRERPAVRQGAVVPRPLMQATLSADHRLVDGVTAARYLSAFKERLENPTLLLIKRTEEQNP